MRHNLLTLYSARPYLQFNLLSTTVPLLLPFSDILKIFCIQSTRIEKISQLLAELNRRCVKMSPIFKEDQIKNALFPMEEENKLRN